MYKRKQGIIIYFNVLIILILTTTLLIDSFLLMSKNSKYRNWSEILNIDRDLEVSTAVAFEQAKNAGLSRPTLVDSVFDMNYLRGKTNIKENNYIFKAETSQKHLCFIKRHLLIEFAKIDGEFVILSKRVTNYEL